MRPRPAARRVALVGTLLAAALVSGCTPAPSGRLDTAAHDGPTVQPSPPSSVTDLPTYDSGTAVNAFADGFPQDLVPVPPEANLIATSAEATADGLVQISLNASSPHGTERILADLGAPLAAAGFVEAPPEAPSGLTALTAWTRRTDRAEGPLVETLLVGVLDEGARRLISVSGAVQPPQG